MARDVGQGDAAESKEAKGEGECGKATLQGCSRPAASIAQGRAAPQRRNQAMHWLGVRS